VGGAPMSSLQRGGAARTAPMKGSCGRPRACLASKLSGGGTRRLH
jgi:hypothetical protein